MRILGIAAAWGLTLAGVAALRADEDFERPVDDAPNIVLIVADDLGYADLHAYGQTKIASPRLAQMAREGMRFTQFYAGAPVCSPSRCVLMTGLHGGHAFIRDNSPDAGGQPETFGDERARRLSLRRTDRTVAELLQSAGYRTGAAGKWGLAEPDASGVPTKKGFDEWLGYLNQNHAQHYFTDHLWRGSRRFEVVANRGGRHRIYTPDLFTAYALDFVTRHRERRFFLYLPYALPHKPWAPPDQAPYAGEGWPDEAKNYAAMITRLDDAVGQVLDHLKAEGLDRNTIVFFTSDNGAEHKPAAWRELFQSSGKLRGKKGSLYEGGIRVPLIVRWPGVVPAGAVSDAVGHFADFLPTAVGLAGLGEPAGLDGQSLIDALRIASPPRPAPRYLYWERPDDGDVHQAARLGSWKAVRHGRSSPVELYNLANDPSETTNLADREPTIQDAFIAYLAVARRESPHWPPPSPVGAPRGDAWACHPIDDELVGSDGTRLHDVDGDGRLDVVSSGENSGITRLYFQPPPEQIRARWPQVTIGVTPSAEEALLADLDGDGAVDVVSSQERGSERITVIWNPKQASRMRDPVAWKQDNFPAVEGICPWMWAAAGQIDGRHGVDLVIGGKRETTEVNWADGTKRDTGAIGWLEAPAKPRDVAAWKWHPLRHVSGTMSIEIADLDGDGDEDILYSEGSATPGAWWLENPGAAGVAGKWPAHRLTPKELQLSGAKFLTIADLDRDGLDDILVNVDRNTAQDWRDASQNFVLWLRRLDATGRNWEPHEIAVPPHTGINKGIAVGDLDNDGRNEIVVSSAKVPASGVGLYYLSWDKDPTEHHWQSHNISGPEGSKFDVIHLVDFNRDGFLDVLANDEGNYDNLPELGVVWYENPGGLAASDSRVDFTSDGNHDHLSD